MKIRYVPTQVSKGKPRNALKREVTEEAGKDGFHSLVILTPPTGPSVLTMTMHDGGRYDMNEATPRDLRVLTTAILRACDKDAPAGGSGEPDVEGL